MISTEAWVIKRGGYGSGPAQLELEEFCFEDITENEVLVEPLYGSWEGNMSHAVARSPIDICAERKEEKVVIGNSGVVRVLDVGANVTGLQEGDIGLVKPVGTQDEHGYTVKVYGYDARGTVGLLAKKTKLKDYQIQRLPGTKHSLKRWAGFSVRYFTAWDNWKTAVGCWRTQMAGNEAKSHVWGWGGGVSLGQLLLAKREGFKTAMIASTDERLELIRSFGITAIDRRLFADLAFDEALWRKDRNYKRSYISAEKTFLEIVKEQTGGEGVAIFVENMGAPVFRASLRALARQGVITTSGWKLGMHTNHRRAQECIQRHIHVHTHASNISHADECIRFAEDQAWLPPVDEGQVFQWEDIGAMAERLERDNSSAYFPIFEVNPVAEDADLSNYTLPTRPGEAASSVTGSS